MKTNLPMKRWALRYGDHVYLDKLYWSASSVRRAAAIESFGEIRLSEIATELDISVDDLVGAIWQRLKRNKHRVQRVMVSELKA